jgi:hypothetical protein
MNRGLGWDAVALPTERTLAQIIHEPRLLQMIQE